MYAMQFAAQRRTEAPRDDLTSLILAGNFGDGPMSDLDFGIFFVQLVTAGNDTTKTMLSAGLLALLQHPEQLAEVRADHVAAARRGRGDPPLREPAPLLPAHRHRRLRAPRHRDRRRRQGAHVLHVGQPRRAACSPTRTGSTSTGPQPAPVVRHRRALLPGCPPGPPRGPGVLRRGAVDVLDHRAHGRPGAGPVEPQQRLQADADAAVGLNVRRGVRPRAGAGGPARRCRGYRATAQLAPTASGRAVDASTSSSPRAVSAADAPAGRPRDDPAHVAGALQLGDGLRHRLRAHPQPRRQLRDGRVAGQQALDHGRAGRARRRTPRPPAAPRPRASEASAHHSGQGRRGRAPRRASGRP